MAVAALSVIKNWFKTGKKPTEAQFGDTWDSFRHKSDNIPLEEVEGLQSVLNDVPSSSQLTNHTNDNSAHGLDNKQNIIEKNQANGYAGLDASSKILVAQLQALLDDAATSGADKTWSIDKIKQAIAEIVDSSPAALDTLNELAAALGDDANFATTVTNALAAKLSITDFVNAAPIYAEAAGTNTYTATFTPAPVAIVAGMRLYVNFINTNTGASTFSPNGLGANAIKRADGTDVQAGDLKGVVLLMYHSTHWHIVGVSGSSTSSGQSGLSFFGAFSNL